MELKGKTLLFLGDSITAGSGVSGKEETYWYRLGQKTCASCIGYGVGGTRIAEQQPDGFEALGNFCTRAQQMQKTADAIIVFGGTNDYGHGDAPLGTLQDRTPKTFYGALHTLILYLLNAYPTAQIVFLTPLHRVGEADRLYNERGARFLAAQSSYCANFLFINRKTGRGKAFFTLFPPDFPVKAIRQYSCLKSRPRQQSAFPRSRLQPRCCGLRQKQPPR